MNRLSQVAMARQIRKLGHCGGIQCSASTKKGQPNSCPLWSGESKHLMSGSCAVEEVSPEAFTKAAEKWLYCHP